jgi:hypothetical protein
MAVNPATAVIERSAWGLLLLIGTVTCGAGPAIGNVDGGESGDGGAVTDGGAAGRPCGAFSDPYPPDCPQDAPYCCGTDGYGNCESDLPTIPDWDVMYGCWETPAGPSFEVTGCYQLGVPHPESCPEQRPYCCDYGGGVCADHRIVGYACSPTP